MSHMVRILGRGMGFAGASLAVLLLTACQSMPAPKFGPGPPPLMGAKKSKTLGPAPITGAAVRFSFATLNGVPADMRFALQDDLKKYAASRQLALVEPGDPTAVYDISGYLSAVGGDAGTLLVYVWDVTDPQGTPLYRISGQEPGGGVSGDPWEGIKEDAIDAAARDTIDKLADWVRG